ncbi:MAG: DUF2779 domain-containing protein [Candidatus Campbellbacteria bacterium]|nr:DUF2779 domain-containing protein [Candidatus Campbellbacteria bacterium]
MNKQISKSEYMMFLKHPAWLWLKKFDKDKIPPPDENLLSLFREGQRFEKVAEQMFSSATKLGFSDFGEYKRLTGKTGQAIRDGAKVILQARFEAPFEKEGSITCISDVVERVEDNTFNLYEIKSSTSLKQDHIKDLAFQKAVLDRVGIDVFKVYVIYVNNQYTRNGEIDPKEISSIDDITRDVSELKEETEDKIRSAFKILNEETKPDFSPKLAEQVALKEWLDICENIYGKIPKESCYNLCRLKVDQLSEFEKLGIKKIKEIPDDFDLNSYQQRQVVITKKGGREIDTENIKNFLSNIKYPLYFLDYETFSKVIPPFDGLRPYQQIPFQYSLHIINKPGEDLVHKEYLHKENSLSIEPLVQQLKNDLGEEGSIVVWYQTFEKGCNTLMSEFVPAEKNYLKSVNERIVDLMIPFSNGYVSDAEFFGSSSIKNVLPVIIPELSYKKLNIQEGASAQRIWAEIVLDGKNPTKRESLFNDLSKYCELDTLAMVKIFEKLDYYTKQN